MGRKNINAEGSKRLVKKKKKEGKNAKKKSEK